MQTMKRVSKMQKIEYKDIELNGDRWRVLGVGAKLNGKTYVHLASKTRGDNRKNGWHPVQVAEWIDSSLLEKTN